MRSIRVQGELYNLPDSLKEVTIGQLIKLRNININNQLQLFTWAIGGKLINLVDTVKTQREVAGVLTLIDPIVSEIFDFFESQNKGTTPETVDLMGLTIAIKPGLVDVLPYWGSVKCKEIMKDEAAKAALPGGVFDPTDRYPEVIAHYLYSWVTRQQYDEREAESFAKEIVTDMPMVDAIQLGNFFLLRLQHLIPAKASYSNTNQQRKKKRRV